MAIANCNIYLHPESNAACDAPFFMSINTMDPNRIGIALQGLTMEGKVVSIVSVPSYKVHMGYTVNGDNSPVSWTCRATATHACFTGLITLNEPGRHFSF